ncbi:hypothetical protein EVAR_25729_1 [Eumeta japonica]|uniref:Uncharacterized protein n=1 Tax=Eumeta variegata TaxID=151549 RepID=A0A4C1VAU0_EUMVA|nr:hypothetical protein EVAR_25729_1 [Eumeta japonica]
MFWFESESTTEPLLLLHSGTTGGPSTTPEKNLLYGTVPFARHVGDVTGKRLIVLWRYFFRVSCQAHGIYRYLQQTEEAMNDHSSGLMISCRRSDDNEMLSEKYCGSRRLEGGPKDVVFRRLV